MDFGIASVAGITVICYLIGQIIKATGLNNKWIPCIVGTGGRHPRQCPLSRCGMIWGP